MKSSPTNSTPKRGRFVAGAEVEGAARAARYRSLLNTQHESDDDEDDESERSDGPNDLAELIQGDHTNDLGEGFLKAKNSSDAYFLAHGKATKTSANLFSSRSNGDGPLAVSEYLDSFEDPPVTDFDDNWQQWRAELGEGFSLLFFGLGSKRSTLNRFVEQKLVEECGWEAVVVNGFQVGMNLSDLIDTLEKIIDGSESDSEEDLPVKKVHPLDVLEARVQKVCEAFGNHDSSELPHCAVIVHNLDGSSLRHPRLQTIISTIAAQPRLHLIATIDHIHAPILLPTQLASCRSSADNPDALLKILPFGYNFLYHHLPTHVPYVIEALLSGTMSNVFPPNIFPPTMLASQASKSDIRQSGPTTIKAVLHVLSSLTKKAKVLFQLMGEYQTDSYQTLPLAESIRIDENFKRLTQADTNTPSIAISSRRLFELCRAAFVASVESQMEALLVEFRDHGIIVGKLGAPSNDNQGRHNLVEDDEEWLWITLCKSDLEVVLSQMDDL